MAFSKKADKKSDGKGKQGKFDDTNRGVLFVNDKGDNENRPDYTGNIAINPEDYEVGDDGLIRVRLAGWNKQSDNVEGGAYLSIACSPQKQS